MQLILIYWLIWKVPDFILVIFVVNVSRHLNGSAQVLLVDA